LGGLPSLLALHVLKAPEMHTYPWHKYYSDSYNKKKFHPGKLKIHNPHPPNSQLQPVLNHTYLLNQTFKGAFTPNVKWKSRWYLEWHSMLNGCLLHIVKEEWGRPNEAAPEAGRAVCPTGCGRASSDPRKSGTTKDECDVQEGLMRYGWRSLGRTPGWPEPPGRVGHGRKRLIRRQGVRCSATKASLACGEEEEGTARSHARSRVVALLSVAPSPLHFPSDSKPSQLQSSVFWWEFHSLRWSSFGLFVLFCVLLWQGSLAGVEDFGVGGRIRGEKNKRVHTALDKNTTLLYTKSQLFWSKDCVKSHTSLMPLGTTQM
jgi:hypothetical protein